MKILSAILLVICNLVLFADAAPDNDNFANAETLTSASVVGEGQGVGATREAGEPVSPSLLSVNTVWFKWTSPNYGKVDFGAIFSTALSSPDYWLQIFVGDDLLNLVEIGRYSDAKEPRGNVVVAKNQSYYIRLSGVDRNPTGAFTIYADLKTTGFVDAEFQSSSWSNDQFNQAIELTGTRARAIGYPLAASREPGEMTDSGSRTLWWKWTAPTTGITIVSTVGGSSNNVVTFGSGSNIYDFDYKSKSFTFMGNAEIAMKTIAGRTYHFAVGSLLNNNKDQYLVTLIHTRAGAPSGGSGVGGKFSTLSRDVLNHDSISGKVNSSSITRIRVRCSEGAYAENPTLSRANKNWKFNIVKSGSVTGSNVTVEVYLFENNTVVGKISKLFKVW